MAVIAQHPAIVRRVREPGSRVAHPRAPRPPDRVDPDFAASLAVERARVRRIREARCAAGLARRGAGARAPAEPLAPGRWLALVALVALGFLAQRLVGEVSPGHAGAISAEATTTGTVATPRVCWDEVERRWSAEECADR